MQVFGKLFDKVTCGTETDRRCNLRYVLASLTWENNASFVSFILVMLSLILFWKRIKRQFLRFEKRFFAICMPVAQQPKKNTANVIFDCKLVAVLFFLRFPDNLVHKSGDGRVFCI